MLWDGAGPGRVPHPRGRLDRPGPAAAGALPGRRARRAAGVPVRHRVVGRPFGSAGRRRGASTPSPWTTRRTSGSASARQRAWSARWPRLADRRRRGHRPGPLPNGCRGVPFVTWWPRWPARASPRPAPGRTAPATARSTWTRTCPTAGSRSAARTSTPGPRGCSRRSGRPGARRRLQPRARLASGRPGRGRGGGAGLGAGRAPARPRCSGRSADVRGDRGPAGAHRGRPRPGGGGRRAGRRPGRLGRSRRNWPRAARPAEPAAGRPLRGAAQPRHAQQPGQRRTGRCTSG